MASDSEASRTDQAEVDGKEGGQTVRRYSVKKSASFKPVSVTKNFLAKAGTATPVKALGDKGT
jgi:hypothetical protein